MIYLYIVKYSILFEEIILLISSIIVKRKELDFNYVIPHNSNLNNSALVYDKGEKQI